jgi:hypothetical protein
MRKIKFLTLMTIALLFHSTINGQDSNDKKIAVKLLKEDFNTLRNKLESTQLGLYLYTSKDSLDKMFDAISASLNEPMTSIEFYRKIAPVNKALRNLHTLFWASAADENGTETSLPRFPLDIHWTDGKMYVLRNHSSLDNIIPGSLVKSINGESVTIIFEKLLECTVRDGFNESYPTSRASRNFSSYYAQLIGTPKSFVVELITPEGTEQKLSIPGTTVTEINTSRVTKFNRKHSQFGGDWEEWIARKEPAFRLEMKGKVAVMTMRSFLTYTIDGGGQQYEQFINDAFNQFAVNKTPELIIDLRNNHGGHDLVGMLLMSHLHDSVFYYYKSRRMLVKPIGKAVKKGNTYEIIGRKGWVGKVTPMPTIYKGNVYVLMNGYSASSTGEFIGHLKNINRAIFIGEEAGGNPVIFTGGQRLHIDLQHTHITGFIPFCLTEMNVELKNNGHGITPDYEVKPGIKDILEERDVEMEFALKLIQEVHTK